MKTNIIKMLMRQVIESAELVEKLAKEEQILDEQWYLDWKDKLNELSIDQPR